MIGRVATTEIRDKANYTGIQAVASRSGHVSLVLRASFVRQKRVERAYGPAPSASSADLAFSPMEKLPSSSTYQPSLDAWVSWVRYYIVASKTLAGAVHGAALA